MSRLHLVFARVFDEHGVEEGIGGFLAVRDETASLGRTPADALAVGDGANDLAMIEAAGLGVAYRAKPIVAAQADAKVDHTDLTTLLYFQGYKAEEFHA